MAHLGTVVGEGGGGEQETFVIGDLQPYGGQKHMPSYVIDITELNSEVRIDL